MSRVQQMSGVQQRGRFRIFLFLVGVVLVGATLACGGGPSGSGGPDPGEARVRVVWDGRTVDWGAPELLRAEVNDAPPGAVVVWRSLSDFYIGQPAILGTGPSITTSALKPGATMVEAALVLGGQGIASDAKSVMVRYRESWNVTLESQVSYPAGTVGDVWVTGNLALVARRGAGGISIVSLDGTAREIGRFTAPNLFTQDVHADGTTAFVSNEASSYRNSVTILDLTDPTDPREVAAISRADTPSAHTLWLDGSILYVASPFHSRLFHAWDVSDPREPRQLATLAATNGSAHDLHARDGIVYGSYLPLGPGQIGELVIASAAPALTTLSKTTYGGAFTHSSWLSTDGRHLYVADEVINAPIRIYDVSNPATPVQVGAYQPRLGTVPHHFLVRDGGIAYLSHYKHGIEVIDLSNPAAPRLIGFYDTHTGPQADQGPTGSLNVSSAMAFARDMCQEHCLSLAHRNAAQSLFAGVWGIHWAADGRIVASDMDRGLFVLRFAP